MGDVNGADEGLGSGTRARVWVRLSIRCMGRLGIWLELESRYNVWVRARWRFRFTVRCG